MGTKVKYLAIIILTCLNYCLTLGDGFELHYSSSFSITPGPIFQLKDSSFIVVCQRAWYSSTWEYHPVDLMLFRISKSGIVCDSVIIGNDDSAISRCFTGHISGDKLFLFASIVDPNMNHSKGLLVKMDTNFSNVIYCSFETPGNSSEISSIISEQDTSFCLSGVFVPDSLVNAGMFVLRINSSGELLKTLNVPYGMARNTLLKIPSENYYQLLADNGTFWLNQSLDSVVPIWQRYSTYPCWLVPEAEMISDYRYITIGNIQDQLSPQGDPISDNTIILRQLDTITISVLNFGAIDSSEWAQPYGLLLSSTDSIAVVTECDVGYRKYTLLEPDDRFISLYLLDTAGNEYWHKTFGTSSNLMGPRIIKTADYGFLIACSEYDYQTYYPNLFNSLYLVKTDSHGNFNTGIEHPNQSEVRVANLGNMISIDLPYKTGILSIYDITGRIIFNSNVYEGSNDIDITGFSPGVYILDITKEGLWRYNKKFFKIR